MEDNNQPAQTRHPAAMPPATVRHVTLAQDGLEVVTKCGMLSRALRLRGYPDSRFQVQDQIPKGLGYRMFTVVIPDGTTVGGEPGGRAFMFGEPALATSENRQELANHLADAMTQLELDRIRAKEPAAGTENAQV
jgi:hypothetical protein